MGDRNNMDKHFSSIAATYHEVRTTDEAPIRFIRDSLDGLASTTAADFGCGTGLARKRHGDEHVHAVLEM